MEQQQDKNKQLNIEVDDKIAQGTYANLAIISHSVSEFIVDFIRIMPGVPKAPVKSRIILTPEHAKRLMIALQGNIKKYESVHGEVKIKGGHTPPNMPMNFGGPTAEA
ncbi:MAG: DUF3467 domain-containing protein [Bacteroidales bacterium]